MDIIDEINTLIKKYAPRPYFTSQEHLEDIIQNESLAEVRADFVMDEWIIGHITEIIEKYQEPKTGRWIGDKAYPICPKCNCNIIEEYISCSDYAEIYKPMNYCPNCGAKLAESEE